MADDNAKYFNVFDFKNQGSTPICVQEKKSIMSVRY